MKIKDLEKLTYIYYNITKTSQDPDPPATEDTNKPLITGTVTPNIASINGAISKLNAAFSKVDPVNSAARAAITKLISYLTWFRTIGIGGESSMTGKDPPTVEEFKQMIRTKLFAEDFITSIAALLQLSYDITPLKNEFALI